MIKKQHDEHTCLGHPRSTVRRQFCRQVSSTTASTQCEPTDQGHLIVHCGG